MTWVEQLMQIEGRLEQAYGRNRLDTFNLLLGERISLLKKARSTADGGEVFTLARAQSERWEGLLSDRLETLRRQRAKMRGMGSYGAAHRSGKLLNRSL